MIERVSYSLFISGNNFWRVKQTAQDYQFKCQIKILNYLKLHSKKTWRRVEYNLNYAKFKKILILSFGIKNKQKRSELNSFLMYLFFNQ